MAWPTARPGPPSRPALGPVADLDAIESRIWAVLAPDRRELEAFLARLYQRDRADHLA